MAVENQFEEDQVDLSASPGEGDAEESSGFDAKKIILFVVLPLFLLIGAGAGLYFTGTLDKVLGKKGDEQVAEAEGGHGKSAEKSKGHGESSGHEAVAGAVFLAIPNLIVNLSGESSKPRYLRLSVQLELANEADKLKLEAVMPRVVDQFQTYLRELRIQDLQGSAGLYRLQMELLMRVNVAAYPVEVKDVLFQEILMQ